MSTHPTVLYSLMYVGLLSHCSHSNYICMLQNGNLINTETLLRSMDEGAHRHINTSSDSELLLNLFADALQRTGKFRINEEDVFAALGALMGQARGAYACVAMLAGFGIIAFRDPNGIRPVGIASRASANGGGRDWLVASESVVADAGGFSEWEDVKPGPSVVSLSIGRVGLTRAQARRSSSRVLRSRAGRSHRRRRSRQTSSSTYTSRARTRCSTAYPFTARAWRWVTR
jgi:glutamine phosphoribosylpyrophosphate amidotransferase